MSESQANENNVGEPSTPVSATETSYPAGTIQPTPVVEAQVPTSFNEVVAEDNNTRVTSFKEVDDNGIVQDDYVPLAVKLDDDITADDSVAIEDEEAPLGVAKSGLGGRVWWYWILIIISAISGKVAKDKRDSKEKEVETEK